MTTLQLALVNVGLANVADVPKQVRRKGTFRKPVINHRLVEYKKFAKQSEEVYNQLTAKFPALKDLIGEWSESLTQTTDYWGEGDLFTHPVEINCEPFSIATYYGGAEGLSNMACKYYYDASGSCGSWYFQLVLKDESVIYSPSIIEAKNLGVFLEKENLTLKEVDYILQRSSSTRSGMNGTYQGQYITIYYNDL